MAARYGASSFSRGARSAFNSFRNSSSASQSARLPPRARTSFENGNPSINRRRLAQTMVPLHSAVSSALLVTRLSISSRSSHSISRGSYKETHTHTVGLIKSRSSTRASGPFLFFLSDAAGVGSSSDLAGLKPIPRIPNVLEDDELKKTKSKGNSICIWDNYFRYRHIKCGFTYRIIQKICKSALNMDENNTYRF